MIDLIVIGGGRGFKANLVLSSSERKRSPWTDAFIRETMERGYKIDKNGWELLGQAPSCKV
jgi:hypothetical protein